MTDDPILDAARHIDEVERYSELQYVAEYTTAKNFVSACMKGDANTVIDWAPAVYDSEASKSFERIVHRQPTLAEIMAESLDFTGGPDMSEMMQLAIDVAFGKDLSKQVQIAENLIGRMAAVWAKNNTPEVDE